MRATSVKGEAEVRRASQEGTVRSQLYITICSRIKLGWTVAHVLPSYYLHLFEMITYS